MSDEMELREAELTCGVRMITAPDGAEIPVPSGSLGGVTTPSGGEAWISDTAAVQISTMGGGYYVVINCAPPANDEARALFEDLTGEAVQELAERVLVSGASFAFEAGLFFGGILASVLTTSRLTREVFIRGDYQGVPITYCILL